MSKKTLYICGDSFCSSDPEYGKNWSDLIAERCPGVEVINLSSPGASNYLIHLQVKLALEHGCSYLIYHATSSIRQEFLLDDRQVYLDTIDRYWSPRDKENKSMVSNSWITPQRNTEVFDSQELALIKEFFTRFVDLPSMIMKNYIFIAHTLSLINDSRLDNWIWNRGGFEHKKFQNSSQWDFSRYSQNESIINLWDDYDNSLWRPYFHITDQALLEKTCNYYINMLNLKDV